MFDWEMEEIANHLGIKPENGGIPLKDNRVIGINICVMGEIELILDSWLIFKVIFLFMIINTGKIIVQYII
jgi:hypothetical protein